ISHTHTHTHRDMHAQSGSEMGVYCMVSKFIITPCSSLPFSLSLSLSISLSLSLSLCSIGAKLYLRPFSGNGSIWLYQGFYLGYCSTWAISGLFLKTALT